MSSPVTDSNINEYGRFDELLKTINLVKSKNTLEKIYNKQYKEYEVNIQVHEILRKFILDNGFDLDSLSNK